MQGQQMLEQRILVRDAEAELEVKRSRFLAALHPVQSEEEARAFLEEIRRKNRDARHNCSAFRIGMPKQLLERSSDDGEPQGTAGKPMLELLKGQQLYDVCAVVTRYFGGILLGTGGLVRAYSDALKAALLKADTALLKAGARVQVDCDYGFSGKVRYLGEARGFYPQAQVFTERCAFTYLMPESEYEGFAALLREQSAGKARVERTAQVLYYGTEKPEIYRVL